MYSGVHSVCMFEARQLGWGHSGKDPHAHRRRRRAHRRGGLPQGARFGNAKEAKLRRLLRRPLPECSADNDANQFRETPLHTAAAYGNLLACMLLLAAGADARRRDWNGRTPADYAARSLKERRYKRFCSAWEADAVLKLLRRSEGGASC